MITVQDVKDYTLTTVDTFDAFIAKSIPSTIEFVEQYTNRKFDLLNPIPEGLKETIAEMIKLKITFIRKSGLKSESLGDYSITLQDDFPSFIYEKLDVYKRKSVGRNSVIFG